MHNARACLMMPGSLQEKNSETSISRVELRINFRLHMIFPDCKLTATEMFQLHSTDD